MSPLFSMGLARDGIAKCPASLSNTIFLFAGLLLLPVCPNFAQTVKQPATPVEEPTAFNTQPKNLLGGNNDVWSVAVSPDADSATSM